MAGGKWGQEEGQRSMFELQRGGRGVGARGQAKFQLQHAVGETDTPTSTPCWMHRAQRPELRAAHRRAKSLSSPVKPMPSAAAEVNTLVHHATAGAHTLLLTLLDHPVNCTGPNPAPGMWNDRPLSTLARPMPTAAAEANTLHCTATARCVRSYKRRLTIRPTALAPPTHLARGTTRP